MTIAEVLAAIKQFTSMGPMVAYVERLPDAVKLDDRVPAAFRVRMDEIKAKRSTNQSRENA